ncbi:MAG: AEC family transporter [Clostridia bacterium]|nr:AEC family transporter [Clostridia bacterium]MBQ9505843.1 AEC family transporter [Clostridia bacterium]
MELFWQNCLIAVKQVVILYIIVAGGYICDKTGVFTEKTARACNNLLFYVITPCVIVNSFMTTEFTADTAKGLLLAACCGALTNTTGILLSLPFFRDRKKPTNAVFKFASVYGNMGYMALPLANAVLGPEGVFYCSAGIMMFQVFCFTHGVWVMSRDGDTNAKFEAKHLFLNPGVIAVCIGLPLFLLKVKVPELFNKPVSFVGSMNTPLAMLMLGTYMSNAGMKTVFKNKEQYLVAAIKIVAVPLAVFAVLKITGLVSGALFTACIIQASAPSANNTVMFAAKYGKDTGIAAKTVSFVSFASVLTMPVMIALTQMQ